MRITLCGNTYIISHYKHKYNHVAVRLPLYLQNNFAFLLSIEVVVFRSNERGITHSFRFNYTFYIGHSYFCSFFKFVLVRDENNTDDNDSYKIVVVLVYCNNNI